LTNNSWSGIIVEIYKGGLVFWILIFNFFLSSCSKNSLTIALQTNYPTYTVTAQPTSTDTPQPTLTITSTATITSTTTITPTITPTEIPLPLNIQALKDLGSMDALDRYLSDTIHWTHSSEIEHEAYGKNVEQTILETLNLNSGDCGEYSRLAYFVMRNHATNFKFVSILGISSKGTNLWHKILVYELPDGKYTYANSLQSVFLNQEPSYHQSFDSIDAVLRSVYYDALKRGICSSAFYINTTEELTIWSKQYPDDPTSNWITGLKPVEGMPFYGEIRTLQDLGIEPTVAEISSN